ncbi:MAG: hypothetical protein ACLUFL_00205 [Flavonifractor plautii]
MTGVAPDASIIGCRIDWTNYFVYAIERCQRLGIRSGLLHGYDHGDVVLTELNERSRPGTLAAEVEAGLADGSIRSSTPPPSPWRAGTLTSTFALDTDGDFTPTREPCSTVPSTSPTNPLRLRHQDRRHQVAQLHVLRYPLHQGSRLRAASLFHFTENF